MIVELLAIGVCACSEARTAICAGWSRTRSYRDLWEASRALRSGMRCEKRSSSRKNLGFGGDVEKVIRQRVDPPVFDVVVELDAGEHNSFRIVRDCATAVDAILRKEKYRAEVRRRHACAKHENKCRMSFELASF